MHSSFLKAVVASALAAIAATSVASAADLAARPYTKAPMIAPVYDWTGFYIGGNVGYSWGRSSDTSTLTNGAGAVLFTTGAGANMDGVIGGGQIGYNWQTGMFVFGAEIDGGYLGARSRTRQSDDLVEVRYGAYGAFTGRAGLAFDRLLSYVKGGAVVANIKNTASDVDGGLTIDPSDFSSTSKAQWGWTIGSGFEYAIAPSWTMKSEYLYMGFGKERSTNLDGDTFEHKNRLHTWKVGLNYKWGGPAY